MLKLPIAQIQTIFALPLSKFFWRFSYFCRAIIFYAPTKSTNSPHNPQSFIQFVVC
ncbi:hypothetical protein DOY81_010694 [Sarcophaga bullata]|nr:hypothetical protein DOY81_010694 [Sarcophaga bullata]